MIFEKDGERYEVTDPAHISCFKAKGWKVVEPSKPAPKARAKKEK